MKKVFFILAAGLLFASCKKDWTCECTMGSLSHSSTVKNKTLKEATDECNDSGSVLGVDYDCSVKVFK